VLRLRPAAGLRAQGEGDQGAVRGLRRTGGAMTVYALALSVALFVLAWFGPEEREP
jgi:hypothetical protein